MSLPPKTQTIRATKTVRQPRKGIAKANKRRNTIISATVAEVKAWLENTYRQGGQIEICVSQTNPTPTLETPNYRDIMNGIPSELSASRHLQTGSNPLVKSTTFWSVDHQTFKPISTVTSEELRSLVQAMVYFATLDISNQEVQAFVPLRHFEPEIVASVDTWTAQLKTKLKNQCFTEGPKKVLIALDTQSKIPAALITEERNTIWEESFEWGAYQMFSILGRGVDIDSIVKARTKEGLRVRLWALTLYCIVMEIIYRAYHTQGAMPVFDRGQPLVDQQP